MVNEGPCISFIWREDLATAEYEAQLELEAEREARAIARLRRYQIRRPRNGRSSITKDQAVYDEKLSNRVFTCPACSRAKDTPGPCAQCRMVANYIARTDPLLAEAFISHGDPTEFE